MAGNAADPGDWQDDPGDWEDELRQDFGDAGGGRPAPPTAPAPEQPAPPPKKSAYETLRAVIQASGADPLGLVPEEKTARGALASVLQGPTMNWADEVSGLLHRNDESLRRMREGLNATERSFVLSRFKTHVANGMANQAALDQAVKDLDDDAYRQGRDAVRLQEDAFREAHPLAAFGLSTAAGTLAPVPGSDSPSFVNRLLGAGAMGAVSGAGRSEDSGDMVPDAALGSLTGATGQALGEGLGQLGGATLRRISKGAGKRVAAAEQKALDQAAEKVAAEIASAKGRLGATTQEANRALENLLRLEATGGLSGEQSAALARLRESGVLPALQQKLADAMLEQVPGAAGRVDVARAALEGLTSRSDEAAHEAAQDILSGAEAKRQVGERVKRYLPTIVGSLSGAGAGGITGALLGGSPSEALIGALAGAGVRPALRAGQRMLAHPAVQSAMFSPIQSGARAAASGVERLLPELFGSVSRTPEVQQGADAVAEALRQALGQGIPPSRTQALLQALTQEQNP